MKMNAWYNSKRKYVEYLEGIRSDMGITQREMAAWLNISHISYSELINKTKGSMDLILTIMDVAGGDILIVDGVKDEAKQRLSKFLKKHRSIKIDRRQKIQREIRGRAKQKDSNTRKVVNGFTGW